MVVLLVASPFRHPTRHNQVIALRKKRTKLQNRARVDDAAFRMKNDQCIGGAILESTNVGLIIAPHRLADHPDAL